MTTTGLGGRVRILAAGRCRCDRRRVCNLSLECKTTPFGVSFVNAETKSPLLKVLIWLVQKTLRGPCIVSRRLCGIEWDRLYKL
jgi:hypothetical protein